MSSLIPKVGEMLTLKVLEQTRMINLHKKINRQNNHLLLKKDQVEKKMKKRVHSKYFMGTVNLINLKINLKMNMMKLAVSCNLILFQVNCLVEILRSNILLSI